MGRFMLLAGIGLALFGVVVIAVERFAPGFRFGRLPGDIVIKRDGFAFYLPITTMLLLSAVITLIFWAVSAARR